MIGISNRRCINPSLSILARNKWSPVYIKSLFLGNSKVWKECFPAKEFISQSCYLCPWREMMLDLRAVGEHVFHIACVNEFLSAGEHIYFNFESLPVPRCTIMATLTLTLPPNRNCFGLPTTLKSSSQDFIFASSLTLVYIFPLSGKGCPSSSEVGIVILLQITQN